MSTALPPIDQSLLPADVRNASTQTQQRYEAGLAFEQQLTAQLSQQLTDSLGATMSDSPYAQLLPDALASAVTASGGLGLARQLAGLGPEVSGTTAQTAADPQATSAVVG